MYDVLDILYINNILTQTQINNDIIFVLISGVLAPFQIKAEVSRYCSILTIKYFLYSFSFLSLFFAYNFSTSTTSCESHTWLENLVKPRR